ncbi:RNA-binding S4 domain-containing protein [Gleimia sp. 6138-11-ORH1]|uniref:RNA-binding S4 domain-containing protein n=1 Tax=Gleimia sp. 6138-11-ORH1 TaxID=2973937 RepID=UPI002166FDE7|nr:RNA-binding S4 domain-containing protein [Gleimia sp. 6138-11-ORH1]MCS4484528.1 RNA-binding S4 domain-containing protein [Gleimia sp. 6138-11-ORH1]
MQTENLPTITVTGTIRLGQLLKLANLVEDGAEARSAIQGGWVQVDGVVQTQRGKQLQDGQIISVDFGDHLESVRLEVLPQ